MLSAEISFRYIDCILAFREDNLFVYVLGSFTTNKRSKFQETKQTNIGKKTALEI